MSYTYLSPYRTLKQRLGTCVYEYNYRTDELADLVNTFGWVRMDLAWSVIESTVGTYDFTAYDTAVNQYLDQGMGVVLILCYGNKDVFNSLGYTTWGDQTITDYFGPFNDETRTAYAAYCAEVAAHFKDQKVIYEIWNEPHGSGYWRPWPNAYDYALTARRATQAIKTVDPDAMVITGGGLALPSNVDWADYAPQNPPLVETGRGKYFTWEWCKQFTQDVLGGGAAVGADGFSVHLYQACVPPEFPADEQVDFLRGLYRGAVIDSESGVYEHMGAPKTSGAWLGLRWNNNTVMGDELAAKLLVRKVLYESGNLRMPMNVIFSWRQLDHDPYVYGEMAAQRPWAGELTSFYASSLLSAGCGLHIYDPEDPSWGTIADPPLAQDGYYLDGFDILFKGRGYARPIVTIPAGMSGLSGSVEAVVQGRDIGWIWIKDPGSDYAGSGYATITDPETTWVTEPTNVTLYATTVYEYNREPLLNGSPKGHLFSSSVGGQSGTSVTGPDVYIDGPLGYTTAAVLSNDQRMNVADLSYVAAYPKAIGTVFTFKSYTPSAPAALALTTSVNAGITTIAVSSTSGYPSSGALRLGNEYVTYTTTDSTHFKGLTRGKYGTSDAAHGGGTSVTTLYTTHVEVELASDELLTLTVHAGGANNFPYIGMVKIEDEYIGFTGKTADTITGLTRGMQGTTPAVHAVDKDVVLVNNSVPGEVNGWGIVSNPTVAMRPDVFVVGGVGYNTDDEVTFTSLNGVGTGLVCTITTNTLGSNKYLSTGSAHIKTGSEGSGYRVGEFLKQNTTTGTGRDIVARVTRVDESGAVTGITVDLGGLQNADELIRVTYWGANPDVASGVSAGPGSVTENIKPFYTPNFVRIFSQGAGYDAPPLILFTNDPNDTGVSTISGASPGGARAMAELGMGADDGKVVFVRALPQDYNNGLYYTKKPTITLVSGKDSLLCYPVTADGELKGIVMKGPGCAIKSPSEYKFSIKGGKARAVWQCTNATGPVLELVAGHAGQGYYAGQGLALRKATDLTPNAGETMDRCLERLYDAAATQTGAIYAKTVDANGVITSFRDAYFGYGYTPVLNDYFIAAEPGAEAVIDPIWRPRPTPRAATLKYAALRSVIDILGDCVFEGDLGSACTIHQKWITQDRQREFRVIWSRAPEPAVLTPKMGYQIGAITTTNSGTYAVGTKPTLTFSGPTGEAAEATVVMTTGLYMAAAAPSAAGTGYTEGTNYQATITGGGSPVVAAIILFDVTAGGAVTNVRVHEKGGDYTSDPTVAFENCAHHDGSAGTSGAGTGATLISPELVRRDYVSSVNVTKRGAYTASAPVTITVTGGTVTVAAAFTTTMTNNKLLRVAVEDQGWGYPFLGECTLTGTGGTTDATGNCMTFNTSGIQAVHITDGGSFPAGVTATLELTWTKENGDEYDFSAPDVVLDDGITVIQAWDWMGRPIVVGNTTITPTDTPIIIEVVH